MIIEYINPNSINQVLNKFADFIVDNINRNKEFVSEIHVQSFDKIIIVNGVTTSKEIQNLIDLKNKFLELNKKFFSDDIVDIITHFKIIDIIQYNHHPYNGDIFNFNYYNSKRPLFNKKVIDFVEKNKIYNQIYSIYCDDNILIKHKEYSDFFITDYHTYLSTYNCSSTFPHGYSNKIGRTPLFYGEYVCNHLFNYLNIDKIFLKFNIGQTPNEDTRISIITDSNYLRKDIESLVLDVFDFNLNKFESDFMTDTNLDLDFETKKWLVKDKIRDILIV